MTIEIKIKIEKSPRAVRERREDASNLAEKLNQHFEAYYSREATDDTSQECEHK